MDIREPPPTDARGRLKIFSLGLVLGFLHVSLFRELSHKIPMNFFFPHFMILAFTGMAIGLFYGKKAFAFLKRFPYVILFFFAVFLLGIWVYRGDSIFFWTMTLYYPMPIPEYGWIKAFFFLTAVTSLPVLFFLLACPFTEVWEADENPRWSFFLFLLGMAAGTLLGYPAQFLGPEIMFLIGCMALLVLLLHRPLFWGLGLLLAAGILLYGHGKKNYPILLSLKDYRLLESRTTDHYKVDYYGFRDETCVAQAVNEFIHVFTCRDAEDLPLELSYLNKVLSEGLEDYRVLIAGCSIALFPHQLLHANPLMEKCVLVDVDRQMIESVQTAQEAVGLNLYRDKRFVLKASEPRHYLDHDSGTYDLLYFHRIGNALVFYPYTVIPIEYYLLTAESLEKVFHSLLEKDGVYIMDWGIPDEWEVQQFVASFPEDVSFRAFWTTLSNKPLSGAPLVFVLASRSRERLDDVASRLLQSTYFHEVRQDRWSVSYRITDDRPWLKIDVVIVLTLLVLPFFIPLYLLHRKTRSLEAPRPWKPKGAGRRYYLLIGVVFSLFHAFALGRITRLSPFGITPGWLLVEAVFLLGFASGVVKSFTDWFRGREKILFLLLALACSLGVYLLDTLESFPAAMLVLAFLGFFLGQAFGYGFPLASRSQRSYLYGFQLMGTALGVGLFQVLVLPLGFRMAGFVAVLLLLVAGVLYAEGVSASSVSGPEPPD